MQITCRNTVGRYVREHLGVCVCVRERRKEREREYEFSIQKNYDDHSNAVGVGIITEARTKSRQEESSVGTEGAGRTEAHGEPSVKRQ